MGTWCELHLICFFWNKMLAPKAAHVLGLTAFERPITEVGGLQGEWLQYATVDSFWLFKSWPFCNSFSKAPSFRKTSIIILPLHRRLHQWLQSFFCVLGFFHYECWISSINWSPFPPSVWTWTPWVQSFPMHFALPWLSVFQAMGREAKGTYWMRLMRAAQLHNIIYIICSIPWHAEYEYYFSTADL